MRSLMSAAPSHGLEVGPASEDPLEERSEADPVAGYSLQLRPQPLKHNQMTNV